MDMPHEWNASDKSMLAVALLSTLADVESTKRLIDRGHIESNPLLGENPSDSDLNRSGLLAAATGLGLASIVSEEVRTPLLGAWAGLEMALANQNEGIKKDGRRKGFGRRLEQPLMAAALGGLLGALIDRGETGIGFRVGPDETALTYTKKF